MAEIRNIISPNHLKQARHRLTSVTYKVTERSRTFGVHIKEINEMINGILPKSWTSFTHTALRVMTGLLLLQHGTAKMLGFPMNDMLKGMFGGMPGGMLYFTGLLELVAGILIVLGLFTRSVAFILAGFMAVAYFMAHAPQGFFPILNFGELAVLYCFVFLWLATSGSGPYSLDAARGKQDA
jgi:putative oxidoreductase